MRIEHSLHMLAMIAAPGGDTTHRSPTDSQRAGAPMLRQMLIVAAIATALVVLWVALLRFAA